MAVILPCGPDRSCFLTGKKFGGEVLTFTPIFKHSGEALVIQDMESKRQQKFSRLIQKELSDIFQKEGLSFHDNTIITITTVRVSPDLSVARVYLSIYNSPNREQALITVKSKTRELRYKLGAEIKNQARIVPHLEFFIDDSIDYASRIDEIFNKINKEGSEE
jgi:ribosome-binding factor A